MTRINRKIASPLRRNLINGTVDGVAFSLMVSFGETYLGAFVLATGHAAVWAGWVSTMPLVVGAILQLISLKGVRIVGSHKWWVVACASAQGLAFIPLIVATFSGESPLWLPFLAATLYWGAGMATGPAWNAWSESIVPRKIRTRYFTARIRATQVAALIGLLVSGFLLEAFRHANRTMIGFGCLFAGALGFRSISSFFLSKQSDAPVPFSNDKRPMLVVLREFVSGPSSRLLFYLMALQFAAHVAAPFFTPYMLSELKLSYTSFMLLLSVASMGRILVLPYAARLAGRIGIPRVILIAGIMVVPMPVLWLVSDDLAYLVLLQVAGGVAWATFELATFLHWFEAIPQVDRTKTLTLYNVMNAVAIVSGSLVGGYLLQHGIGDLKKYSAIFTMSTAFRFATLGLYYWAFRALLKRPMGTVEIKVVPYMPMNQVDGIERYNRRGANRHVK